MTRANMINQRLSKPLSKMLGPAEPIPMGKSPTLPAMTALEKLQKELASSSTHNPMPLGKAIKKVVRPLSLGAFTTADLTARHREILSQICQAMIVPRAMMGR